MAKETESKEYSLTVLVFGKDIEECRGLKGFLNRTQLLDGVRFEVVSGEFDELERILTNIYPNMAVVSPDLPQSVFEQLEAEEIRIAKEEEFGMFSDHVIEQIKTLLPSVRLASPRLARAHM